MSLENHLKILLPSPYLNFFRFELDGKAFISFSLLCVCSVRRKTRSDREEPVDKQYCEQVCEDQYRNPEPEGQYFDQDFPEGFVNGKFNPILRCIFLFQFYKHNLLAYFF